MNEHVNPYQSPGSPQSGPQPGQEAGPESPLVARGRLIFWILAAVVALLEISAAATGGYDRGSMVRVALTIGLLVAVWQGRQWAITLTALLFALGAIIFFLYGLSTADPIGVAVGAFFAIVSGAIAACFVISESLNEFFRHQRRVSGHAGFADEDAIAPSDAENMHKDHRERVGDRGAALEQQDHVTAEGPSTEPAGTRASASRIHVPPGPPVIVYAARNLPEAHQLRNLLAEAEIKAVVINAALQGGAGVDILGWPTAAPVAVAEEDAAVARQMALDFEERIAPASAFPFGESADPETEPAPGPPVPWPRCPGCDAPRITKCPICETAGTDFAQADPEFVGTPEQDAQPTSCECGSCGHPPEGLGAEAEGAAAAASETGITDTTQGKADTPRLMLICPTCDEAFVPEFPRRCEWCGHEFDDGYDPQPAPESRERISPRAIAVIIGLLVLGVAFVLYFASLF